MKTKMLLFLCFTPLFLIGQETPKLNTGIDFLIFNKIDNIKGTLKYSLGGGFFVEKPLQINLPGQFVLSP